MSATPTAATALEALWQVLVETVEAANDIVVLGQKSPTGATCDTLARSCRDIATLAHAAVVLARLAEPT